jgi:Tfp pilus assembly protein PilF
LRLAYIGVAKSHLDLPKFSKQDEDIATEAAEHAIALDPNLADAHEVLGEIRLRARDWPGAEEEYRRATASSFKGETAVNNHARGVFVAR